MKNIPLPKEPSSGLFRASSLGKTLVELKEALEFAREHQFDTTRFDCYCEQFEQGLTAPEDWQTNKPAKRLFLEASSQARQFVEAVRLFGHNRLRSPSSA